MKSSFKIVFIIFISLIFIACGAIFFASKKLKPEELRKIFIAQIESSLPNTIVKTSSIDFSLGLTSVATINGIDITLKGTKQFPLLKLDKLKLEIPFWSIIFGGGKIEFVVNNPDISYIELNDSSNWKMAMGNQNSVPVSSDSQTTNLILPGFLANSEINIKLENINIVYALKDKSKGKLVVEKFVFKDIGLKSTTVFELKSNLNIFQNTPNHTSLDLLVIGETNLSEYISSKKINLKTQVILSNIVNKTLAKKINKIAINSQSTFFKSSLSSSLSMVFEEKDLLSAKLNYEDGNIEVSDLVATINLKDILSHVSDLSLLPLSLNGNELVNIKGGVAIGPQIVPALTIITPTPIKVVKENIKADITINANVNSKMISVNSEVQTFSGKVITEAKLPINWNKMELKSLEPLNLIVSIRDLKISNQSLIFSNSPKSNPSKSSDEKVQNKDENNVGSNLILPLPLKAKVEIVNVLLGDAKLEGILKLVATNKGVTLNGEKITIDNGEISLNSTVVFKGNNMKTNLQAGLKDIDLKALSPFLPKDMLEAINGVASGNLVLDSQGSDYIAKVDATLSDGKLSKINLKSYVEGLVDKLGKYKDKVDDDKLKIDGEFKTLSFKGVFDNKKHQIQNSYFLDKKQKISITGAGNIHMVGTTTSELAINIKVLEQNMAQKLKSEIGTDTFPVRVSGVGYDLRPDYTHTIKSVAKEAVKEQGKKQIEKLLKNGDAKKLLKGLFK